VRVIEIKRNLLEYDKTQITLGNFKPDLAKSQLAQADLNKQVQDNSGIWDNGAALVPSVLDPAMYDLTSKLRAAGGYVVFDPVDGIMIYDTPNPETATKAMKLGAGMFGIADSKTLGVWDWKSFGTGSGFTADLMTAGKMMADRIQIGTGAQALGFSNFYWDTSGLYAISGLNVVKITPTGIYLGTNGVGGAFSLAVTGAGIAGNTIDLSANTSVKLAIGATTCFEVTSAHARFKAADGSYTEFVPASTGLTWHKGTTAKDYHYLSAVGTGSVGASAAITITLPVEFRGKSFTVLVSLRSPYGAAFVSSQNNAAGTFVATNASSLDTCSFNYQATA